MRHREKKPSSSHILGFPLPKNEVVEFIFLASGIVFFYVIYGWIQEYMNTITKAQDVHMSWFITCCQFFTYAFFSFLFTFPLTIPDRQMLMAFAKVGVCSLATIGFSNNANEYLNYPTAVIFKCCKLILVIIVGTVLFKKNYQALDYIAAFFLTFGLAFFSLGDYTVAPKFNFLGMILMTGSLTADAFIGNLQEQLLGYQKNKLGKGNFSVLEQVFYPKFIGGCCLFVVSLVNGHFFVAVEFTRRGNSFFWLYVMVFGFVGMVGENFILTLMAKHGVVVTLTTTTVRKILTILLSFYLFTKPFTYIYLVGGAFTVTGIILTIYRKSPQSFHLLFNRIRRLRRQLYHEAMERTIDV